MYRKLTVAKAKTSTADEQRKEVTVDPNITVSSALSVILRHFGFKNDVDSEGEEYGLTMIEQEGKDTWLDELKKLGDHRALFASPNVLLRRKPWLLKVSPAPPSTALR